MLDRPTTFQCEPCKLAKSVRHRPKPLAERRSSRPLEYIHSDLSGRFSVQPLKGSQYFLPFIDDFTRFCWVYFVVLSDDVPHAIDSFLKMVETQHDVKVLTFGSDNGGEYVNATVAETFRNRGIAHKKSPPYHHESNGIPERFMRTIVTDARTEIRDETFLFLWPEAISHATYLRNRKPHSALPCQITPFEALKGQKPSVGHSQPYFRSAYLHVPGEARKPGTKLLDGAEKVYFVGFEADGESVFRPFVPSRKAVVTATSSHVTWSSSKPSKISWTVDSEVVPEIKVSLQQLPSVEAPAIEPDDTRLPVVNLARLVHLSKDLPKLVHMRS